MKTSTLTSKGQVTIPKEIRDFLKLKTGDLIDFIIDRKGQVVVRAGTVHVGELKGLLKVPGRKPVSLEEMDRAILRQHGEPAVKGLDTNVLVRYLTQDDPEQARKASALLQDAAGRGERCFINSVVLCELVWVLRGAYGYGKDEACLVLEKILSTVEFSIEDKELAYRALEDYRSGGDFADHLIGWRNGKAGCDSTITFDRGLKGSSRFTVL